MDKEAQVGFKYRCWDDCRPDGCPGHTVTAITRNVIGYISFFDDGREFLSVDREKAKAMFDAYQALVSTPEAAGRADDQYHLALMGLSEKLAALCGEKLPPTTGPGYAMGLAIRKLSAPPSGEQASTTEVAGREDERVWGILYDDAAVLPEIFIGEGAENAARAIYKQRSDSWACHLVTSAPPSGEQAFTPEAAGREDGWIPVADGLPKHGGQVEITFWLNEHNGPFVTIARHEKGRWDWNSVFANAHRRDEDVTAWRDLPRPYQPKITLPPPPSGEQGGA